MARVLWLLQWLNSNRQWVFSGIGVAVGAAILAWVLATRSPSGGTADRSVDPDYFAGHRLRGPSEINAAFESIAATGSRRIQLLIQVLGPHPHLPEPLSDTIARRIAETNERGVPIKYDPILIVDAANAPPAFLTGAARRGDVFSRRGVSQFVRPRFIDQRHNGGLDVLIVDQTHLLITLNTVPSAQAMQVGILFRDQPAIASEFSDWFDQVLLPSSRYLDTWLIKRAEDPSVPKSP